MCNVILSGIVFGSKGGDVSAPDGRKLRQEGAGQPLRCLSRGRQDFQGEGDVTGISTFCFAHNAATNFAFAWP